MDLCRLKLLRKWQARTDSNSNLCYVNQPYGTAYNRNESLRRKTYGSYFLIHNYEPLLANTTPKPALS
jgi:hypothetical protein